MTDRPPAISRQLTTLALLALAGATVAACRSAAPPAASAAPATTPAVAPVVVSTADTTPASPVASSASADTAPHPQAAAPDVHFMHHMIMHHGQALTMTALVPTRTTRESMRLLAERITISQQGEIALMRRWLADRHAPDMSPDMHGMAGMGVMGGMGADHAAHHGGDSTTAGHAMAMPGMKMDSAGGMPMMPGMLTPAELDQLAKASGTAFDRLFLQFMIRHHEGALTMVKEYFSTPGAGRDPAAFRFASDVDADQRAEIARMRALARSLPNE